MVIVSCITKFHAFALAEQLQKHKMLEAFYTTYAYQKNTLFRRFAKREDREQIPVSKIHTNILQAALVKKIPKDFVWNEMFDKWVASKIKHNKNYKVFIGWSSMSLNSIREAHKKGKIAIVERGSSHIEFQNKILKEEYKKFNIDFEIDARVIEKEMREYEEADYISIPSLFVKRSFLEYGVPEKKLILNNYGASDYFRTTVVKKTGKFRVLYLGSLIVRKGLVYLFEALNDIQIPKEDFEVWFIGKVDDEIKRLIKTHSQKNWIFKGHVNHYELPELISQCDVALQPSIEEGLSMVIAQLLKCGIPVIATTNSGGEDLIVDYVNGFIVPIRSSIAIREKLELLFNNRNLLDSLKANALNAASNGWSDYGNRYSNFIKQII
jgi:glycosyltransferase involved in cell wall biosynthesis